MEFLDYLILRFLALFLPIFSNLCRIYVFFLKFAPYVILSYRTSLAFKKVIKPLCVSLSIISLILESNEIG